MKLLKGKTPEPRTEGRLVALPVRLCEPHPDLQTRLKYDQVDALAEDIRAHGQLQPGRAVERPDGTGYWVYMGIGRLLAIKKLFEKEGGPKSYYALLDEGLPFVELFSRSMSENLKRRNLSVLEEVRSFWLASKKADEEEIIAASSKIGEEPSAVRKRIEVAGALEGKLEKLYDVEAHARFGFQIGHLEALAKVDGEKQLYETAAAAAHARFSVKELQISLKNKSIDKIESGLPEWFYEVFPEYAKRSQIERDTTITVVGERSGVIQGSSKETKPEEEKHADSPPNPTQEGETASASTTSRADISTTTTRGSGPPAGVAVNESQAFVECPYCGGQAPFELKEDSELTLVRFKGSAVPEKDSVAPEGSYRRLCECYNPECREKFWLWAALIDGELRAEARGKDDREGWFGLPKENPTVGSVSWSGEKKSWVVKVRESGKEYLYGENRKFVEA